MWSLPDIVVLNARAAANARNLKRAARRKRKPHCEHHRCAQPARRSFLVYDIFSDDPKDVLHLCDNHVGYSGDPAEGLFTCAECNRVMVENFTWELYYTWLDGEKVCLKCAAEIYFADDLHWIEPDAVDAVVLAPDGPPLFADGVLNVARCPHVLGVEQPLPKGVRFVENCEFDNVDGHQISGRDLLQGVRDLAQPFCPVLDAGYQFAVSIGLYVRTGAALGNVTARRH
jgi:hypothetical protein